MASVKSVIGLKRYCVDIKTAQNNIRSDIYHTLLTVAERTLRYILQWDDDDWTKSVVLNHTIVVSELHW